jgi:hypothetical protein
MVGGDIVNSLNICYYNKVKINKLWIIYAI